MTRTTQALRRLGVAGVAVATMGAGLAVPFATPAFANHTITQVVLTPDTATAPSGTCQTFTATLNAGGSPSRPGASDPANTLDVQLTQGSSTPGAPSTTADFCDPTTGALLAGPNREFTDTDKDGVITFGVVNVQAAGGTTTTVTAFVETVDDDIRTNEPFDQSVLTTQRAANNNDVSNVTVFADSKNATNVVGEQHNVSVRIDSGTSAVAGITPEITVTGANTVTADGNQFGATCTASDSRGIATCSYTGTNAGQDNITIYVNQSRAGQAITSGRDAGEPGDTATKTYVTAAPAGSTVTLSCPSGTFGPDADTCVRTTGQGPGTVTATVTNNGSPVANAIVRFAVSGSTDSDVETVTPREGQTNAAGQVTVTVNDATPTVGDQLTVTATLTRFNTGTSGATNNTSDTINIQYRNTATPANARNVTLSPENVSTRAGDNQTFVAVVVDSFGTPVVGATVTFRSSGAGSFAGGAQEFTTTTDSQGRATVTATSASTASAGTQTITAFITQGGCAGGATGPNSQPNGANATTVQLQCSDTSTNNITPRTTAPNPSDTAVARITLLAETQRITAGNAPRLFGVATDANGDPVRNARVILLEKVYGSDSYREVAGDPIVTDENGRWSTRVRPDRQRAYVARVVNEGGSTVQSDQGGNRALVILVHNRINIANPAAVPNTNVTGGALTVRGDLDPNFASVRIGVAILRNGRFTYITQGITDSNGAFVINVRNLPRGSYALVVYTSARQGTLFGSASRGVTVR